MTKYRTTKLEPVTNDLMTNDSDVLKAAATANLRATALPVLHCHLFMVIFNP
jgi:hypothetical protein